MPTTWTERRVVITGLGVLTPIGNDIETFWKNLVAGQCGIDKITAFDAEFFFQRHDQLDDVERVCAEIFDELGFGRHLIRLHAELFDNDVLYTLVNRFISHKLCIVSNRQRETRQALNRNILSSRPRS